MYSLTRFDCILPVISLYCRGIGRILMCRTQLGVYFYMISSPICKYTFLGILKLKSFSRTIIQTLLLEETSGTESWLSVLTSHLVGGVVRLKILRYVCAALRVRKSSILVSLDYAHFI